jgi:hypothetical protein
VAMKVTFFGEKNLDMFYVFTCFFAQMEFRETYEIDARSDTFYF